MANTLAVIVFESSPDVAVVSSVLFLLLDYMHIYSLVQAVLFISSSSLCMKSSNSHCCLLNII